MSALDTLKNAAAIGGSIIGITGGALALGSVIGRTPVEAKLEAHLQPEVIHPESAKRIDGIVHRVEMSEQASRESAAESRKTREMVEELLLRSGTRTAGGRR